MAVEERPELLVLAEEARVDPLGRQRRGERHVAVGESLAEAEEIRGHPLPLAGEHRPGPAEAGRDLVADQEDVVGVAELAHAAEVAGRLDEDAARALDERLDDHSRGLLPVAVEDPLERRRVAGGDRALGEEQRLVGAVKEIDAAGGDRPDGVAVVALAEPDERGPAGVLPALLAPELERHLQRDLGRGRAGVGVEDPVQALGGDRGQPGGQLGRGSVGEAQHRRVRDTVELVADRAVDRRVAVAVDVAPERRRPVDVAGAVGGDQVGPLAALDDERILLLPAALLGERMPQVPVVERRDPFVHPAES